MRAPGAAERGKTGSGEVVAVLADGPVIPNSDLYFFSLILAPSQPWCAHSPPAWRRLSALVAPHSPTLVCTSSSASPPRPPTRRSSRKRPRTPSRPRRRAWARRSRLARGSSVLLERRRVPCLDVRGTLFSLLLVPSFVRWLRVHQLEAIVYGIF